jgi:hypothetical protein
MSEIVAAARARTVRIASSMESGAWPDNLMVLVMDVNRYLRGRR